MRVVIYGAGERFSVVYDDISKRKGNSIVAIIDAKPKSKTIKGIEVFTPEEFFKRDIRFDLIVVTTEIFYKDIKGLLINKYGIDSGNIKHSSYFIAMDTLKYYKTKEQINREEKEVLDRIKKEEFIQDFNYKFVDNYRADETPVEYDKEKGLFYGINKDKRIYLKSTFKEAWKAKNYYKSLLIEQDKNSPHRYFNENFSVKEGDVVLDAGVAEGNFSLEIVERAKKIFLVEADSSWNEAIETTFEPYKEKIVLINKYLSNVDNENSITIDAICNKYKIEFNVIKMDIEGYESKALEGAKNCLINNNVKLAVCSYHNYNDEHIIKQLLEGYGYKTTTSKGYMTFMSNDEYPKKLVRGLVYAQKQNCIMGNR